MGKSNSLSILILLISFFFTLIQGQRHTSQLVEKVCRQTTSYSFCIDSLYTDPRTPQADRYTLAFIAFGLAYNNATNTKSYINELLKQGSSVGASTSLRRCGHDYDTAISAIETASNDLNSETFYELGEYANKASSAAKDCEAAFNGVSQNPLKFRNIDLQGLCNVCAVVAKLYTGGLIDFRN